jgi:hypothetical protein
VHTWRPVARLGLCLAFVVAVSLLTFPATGRPGEGNTKPVLGPSGVVAANNQLNELDLADLAGRRSYSGPLSKAGTGPLKDLFNTDVTGLPQNEESISVCRKRPRIVLGGTNDYRQLLTFGSVGTGWHFSNNGGTSVTNEGLLPPIGLGGNPAIPGGDPVDVVDNRTCELYASSLNLLDPSNSFAGGGIGLYRSTPQILSSCRGGLTHDPSCWPTRRLVAVAPAGHFLDKEWFDVGVSGAAGKVVWVTFSDFPSPNQGADIYAVRCSSDLSQCTAPIQLSSGLRSQFSDVTIADSGSTYVTWIEGTRLQTGFAGIIKLRVAPPGSTTFGPEQIVHVEDLALPQERNPGPLHANDFRVATYPKNEVTTRGTEARVFVVWEACQVRVFGGRVCEEPVIKLRYSDDDGATWSGIKILSAGGDNYFATIADASGSHRLAVAWFTNRFDTTFHNRQDVELTTVSPIGVVLGRQRLTEPSNEPEADPLPFTRGLFIGDYIEVDVERGKAYVHYNANYRQERLVGQGFPVPQQDNYLARAKL